MRLQKCLDLPRHPRRLLRIRRAKHDEIIRIHKGIRNIVGQVHRNRKFCLVTEYPVDFFDPGLFPYLPGDMEMLQPLVNSIRNGIVLRCVFVRYKCVVFHRFPLSALISPSLQQIHRRSLHFSRHAGSPH